LNEEEENHSEKLKQAYDLTLKKSLTVMLGFSPNNQLLSFISKVPVQITKANLVNLRKLYLLFH
jgi:hypothetical protein